MLKIENVEVVGWEPAIRGMRNPMNSWEKSDSLFIPKEFCDEDDTFALAEQCGGYAPVIKENDHKLMASLAKGGPVHAKYRRMIMVYADITAPLYWWKEWDTYKVGTVANSCSTMHKIHAKEFTLDDFSYEHLLTDEDEACCAITEFEHAIDPIDILKLTIKMLNRARDRYLEAKTKPMKEESKRAALVKKYWWQMIQLLPSSYNQKRTVMVPYEVLANIHPSRRHHKLDEWHVVCDWIETLPYSELITMKPEE